VLSFFPFGGCCWVIFIPTALVDIDHSKKEII